MREHFNPKNAKKFYSQGQEFVCLKGSIPERSENVKKNMFDTQGKLPKKEKKFHSMNSNSFFSVIDGDIKIVGLYDGHGK